MLIRIEAVSGGYVTVTDEWSEAQKALQEGEAVIGILSDNAELSPQPAGCWSGVSHFITDIEALEDKYYVQEAYCRFHGLPVTIYRDDLVTVREMVSEDAQEIWQIHNEASVRRYVPLPAENAEELVEVIRSYCRELYGYYHCGIWVIADSVTGEVIGRAGIEPRTEWFDGEKIPEYFRVGAGKNDEAGRYPVEGFFLGYLMREEYRRMHKTERVCREVLAYVREELELSVIYCRIAPENTASIHLAEKLGFIRIGEELYLCRL